MWKVYIGYSRARKNYVNQLPEEMTTMLLAGDIGGTKTRLALFEWSGTRFEKKNVEKFDSKASGSFAEIASGFISKSGAKIEAACFGVPGPVKQGKVKTTNLPWLLEEGDLERVLNIPRIKLVNDLVSYTAAIPHLNDSDLLTLHPGKSDRETTISCVIAPGTGLGQAFLHYIDGEHHVIPSEGGHANFAPNSELEIELWKFLKAEYPLSVSYERLLCGPGLANIYRFLKHSGAAPEGSEAAQRIANKEDVAAVVSALALAKKDKLSELALDIFVEILGGLASNHVLTFLATGGVYLGGGIPPKIIEKLKDGTLLRSYLKKQRLQELVESTPLYVIQDDQSALIGAAVLASKALRRK